MSNTFLFTSLIIMLVIVTGVMLTMRYLRQHRKPATDNPEQTFLPRLEELLATLKAKGLSPKTASASFMHTIEATEAILIAPYRHLHEPSVLAKRAHHDTLSTPFNKEHFDQLLRASGATDYHYYPDVAAARLFMDEAAHNRTQSAFIGVFNDDPEDTSFLVFLFYQHDPRAAIAANLLYQILSKQHVQECAQLFDHHASDQLKAMKQELKYHKHQVEQLKKQVHQLDHFDQLTQLPKRQSLLKRLEDEIKRYERYRQPFCIFIISIDELDDYNLEFGYQMGDELVVSITKTVQAILRNTDFLYRWDSDQLAVLASNTSVVAGITLAERIRSKVNKTTLAGSKGVTTTIGLTFTELKDKPQKLMVRSLHALKVGKAGGGNKVVSYESIK